MTCNSSQALIADDRTRDLESAQFADAAGLTNSANAPNGIGGAGSVASLTTPICRICQMSTTSTSRLISPCECKGSLAFVHLSCLERWLNTSSRISCELCHFQFDARQTRRYTLWQSLRLWVRHPINRRRIQADLFIASLLSIVTLGLVLICLLGLEYFIIEGNKHGVSQIWTKGALSFFLIIVVMGYISSVGFLVKDQLRPWYQWWRNTYNIHLHPNSYITYVSPRQRLQSERPANRTRHSASLDFPVVHSRTTRNVALA